MPTLQSIKIQHFARNVLCRWKSDAARVKCSTRTISGETQESKHFLTNIRKYNTSFQMTSFGATNIIRDNCMPTFKIQGMFHQHNELIQLFTTALDRMPSDDFKIVIRADKRRTGEHGRRYNAPTIEEVAIVIVGEEFRRNECQKHIDHTMHCSSLQHQTQRSNYITTAFHSTESNKIAFGRVLSLTLFTSNIYGQSTSHARIRTRCNDICSLIWSSRFIHYMR